MNSHVLLEDNRADDRTADDLLQAYRRKRRFALTPEPPGGAWQDARSSRFVVQLHHARHRHFDLRLQVGAVLRSWAVPRGPSRDPQAKRLAIETEDHPLEYADFEGVIPQGEYGGGRMTIWDRGFWQADGDPVHALRRGRLGFTLYGKRLSGHWWLHRTSNAGSSRARQWLLIKSRDGASVDNDIADDRPLHAATARARARRTSLPDHTALQLAVPATAPPPGRHWLHELKYDGYRLMMLRDGDSVRLLSRNGLEWTPRLPHVVSALRGLRCTSVVLDGELVVLDAQGCSDFSKLQQAMSRGASAAGTLAIAFDLLLLDGRDCRHLPLTQRRKLLAQLLTGAAGDRAEEDTTLRIAAALPGHGGKAFEAACSLKFEGVIAKDRRAPYASGRSGYWRKVKCVRSDEFVVIGRTQAKGYHRDLGALLLAVPEGHGRWRYVGRVGSGFSDAEQRLLRDELRPAQTVPVLTNPDAVPTPDRARTTWVRPALVVEVHHRGLTGDGLLRQASYKGLRPDKSITDLSAAPMPRPSAANRSLPLALTHPQKTIFTHPKLSKADIAHYYMSVAEQILPEIQRRPIALLRCPDGVDGTCFFQRHLSAGFGPKVHEIRHNDSRAIYIEDLDGLIALVQMGTVEIHAGQATIDRPGFPDRMVFDIDPGTGVRWHRVVAAARTIRERLLSVRLQSFVRTSGGKGLHVVVPLEPVSPVETVKAFAQALARTLAAEQPETFVAVAGESRRRNRIFIDYLRNGRDAWAVASYSLRARKRAPVATPLHWRELSRLGASDHYGAGNVRKRLARLRSEPWQGFDELRQTLPGGTA